MRARTRGQAAREEPCRLAARAPCCQGHNAPTPAKCLRPPPHSAGPPGATAPRPLDGLMPAIHGRATQTHRSRPPFPAHDRPDAWRRLRALSSERRAPPPRGRGGRLGRRLAHEGWAVPQQTARRLRRGHLLDDHGSELGRAEDLGRKPTMVYTYIYAGACGAHVHVQVHVYVYVPVHICLHHACLHIHIHAHMHFIFISI